METKKQSRVVNFFYNEKNRLLHGCIIAFLLSFSYIIVYIAGGTKTAYPYLFIIVIIYSGIIFNVKGALTIGVVSSILMGPFMQMDVISSIPQEPFNYMFRAVFYITTGLVIGVFSLLDKNNNNRIEYMLGHHHLTKLPIVTPAFDLKYKDDISSNKYEILFFRINNYRKIIQSFSLEIWADLLYEVYVKLQSFSDLKYDLYQIDSSEFLIVTEANLSQNYADEFRKVFKILLDEKKASIFLDIFYGVVPFDSNIVSMIQKGMSTLDYASKNNVKMAHYHKKYENKQEDLEIINSFREELQNNRLFVVFQPIVDSHTNKVNNIEVLTRWNHSKLGIIPPGRFIKLVEETTLINDLSHWLVKECIRLLPAIISENEDVVCSINISSRNLYDNDFVQLLETLLRESGIPMKNINIELTERSVLKLSDQSKKFFNEVRKLGVSLSIDDFGTGFSTFSYITQFDIDFIKIDKSFITNIDTDKKAYNIVKNMCSLAKSLHIEVVAEGVETIENLNVVKELGIRYIQGYYYAKPLEYNEIITFIDEFNI
jgi:EAL domain-containing protein (putative c-di-GMP-specific phosphodiesterase class I)/GGDEF domain-containing protein